MGAAGADPSGADEHADEDTDGTATDTPTQTPTATPRGLRRRVRDTPTNTRQYTTRTPTNTDQHADDHADEPPTRTPTGPPVGNSFFTITPCRVLDRLAGPSAAPLAGLSRFPVTGLCAVPSTARVGRGHDCNRVTGDGRHPALAGRQQSSGTSAINFNRGDPREQRRHPLGVSGRCPLFSTCPWDQPTTHVASTFTGISSDSASRA
jgi:hypothetical protein